MKKIVFIFLFLAANVPSKGQTYKEKIKSLEFFGCFGTGLTYMNNSSMISYLKQSGGYNAHHELMPDFFNMEVFSKIFGLEASLTNRTIYGRISIPIPYTVVSKKNMLMGSINAGLFDYFIDSTKKSLCPQCSYSVTGHPIGMALKFMNFYKLATNDQDWSFFKNIEFSLDYIFYKYNYWSFIAPSGSKRSYSIVTQNYSIPFPNHFLINLKFCIGFSD